MNEDQATLSGGEAVDPLLGRPGCGIVLADAWPAGRLQAQLDRIEEKLTGNRWSGFTDDEMADLSEACRGRYDYHGGIWNEALADEADAEHERRKT